MPDTFPALFAAYSVVWGVLVIYIWTLGGRVARLERDDNLRSKESDGTATRFDR